MLAGSDRMPASLFFGTALASVAVPAKVFAAPCRILLLVTAVCAKKLFAKMSEI